MNARRIKYQGLLDLPLSHCMERFASQGAMKIACRYSRGVETVAADGSVGLQLGCIPLFPHSPRRLKAPWPRFIYHAVEKSIELHDLKN